MAFDGCVCTKLAPFHVYIVTGLSLRRGLYVGVTSNLVARLAAHRSSAVPGFTARYRLWKLVYAERRAPRAPIG
jgi:putative endonuclease